MRPNTDEGVPLCCLLPEVHSMWNSRGKRHKQIRGFPASRLPGSRSGTRLPVIDLSCNAVFVTPDLRPVAAHLESQLLKPRLRPTFSVTQVRADRSSSSPSSSLQYWRASSQLSATRQACLWPLLAAWHSQRKICGRLKRAASTKTRRREIGCREKIPAHLCAGDDPPLPVIGRCCWPHCQQIHAIAEMLHGRPDGRSGSRSILIPGIHYILTSQPAEGELSPRVYVREEAISSYRTPAPHNLINGQPRNGFRGLALIAKAKRDINSFLQTCLLALASRSWKARDRSQSKTRWSDDTNAAIPLPSGASSRLSSYVQNTG
jgi:hypothetical protein